MNWLVKSHWYFSTVNYMECVQVITSVLVKVSFITMEHTKETVLFHCAISARSAYTEVHSHVLSAIDWMYHWLLAHTDNPCFNRKYGIEWYSPYLLFPYVIQVSFLSSSGITLPDYCCFQVGFDHIPSIKDWVLLHTQKDHLLTPHQTFLKTRKVVGKCPEKHGIKLLDATL